MTHGETLVSFSFNSIMIHLNPSESCNTVEAKGRSDGLNLSVSKRSFDPYANS